MKCAVCGEDISKLIYAIREFSNDEGYFSWIWRHMKYLLTRGFRKYTPFFLPVCCDCVASGIFREAYGG